MSAEAQEQCGEAASSDENTLEVSDSAEPHEQHGESAPSDETTLEVSVTSQRSITDYFSPCSSTRLGSDSAPPKSSAPPFIRPFPSVNLAEVPVVFQVQSDCNVEDCFDPLFEREIPGSSLELPSFEQPAEVDPKIGIEVKKRERRYSTPSIFATWNDRTASGSSKDEISFGSPAQLSELSLAALPGSYKKKLPFDCRSLPPILDGTDSTGDFAAEDDKADEAETVNDPLHNNDAADMTNENFQGEITPNPTECQPQYQRAEEALALMKTVPTKKITAESPKAKADAESRMTEMESEKDFLEAQLEQRCNSVAHLTQNLSKVTDKWAMGMTQYDIISHEYENLLSEKESFEDTLQQNEEHIEKLEQKCKDKDISEEALKECLKEVFERLVRCTLCLKSKGYMPFDESHQAIYRRVSELTGQDHQEPLVKYYADAEHNIQDEFEHNGEGVQNVADDEGVLAHRNGGWPGVEEQHLYEDDQGNIQGSSSAPTSSMVVDGSVNGIATKEREAQELNEVLPTIQTQAVPAVTNPFSISQDQRENTFSNIWQGLGTSTPTIPEPESSNGSTFPTRIFQMTDIPTPAVGDGADVGKHIYFGFSKDPPSSFFGNAAASFETSAKTTDTSTFAAPAAAPSTAKEGHNQDIWKNISFTTGKGRPFSSSATPAADFGENSNERHSIFKNLGISPLPEAKTPVSQESKNNQGTEATEAQKQPAPSPKEAVPSHQLQDFNFGNDNGQSSSSSTPNSFQSGEQNVPRMTAQAEETAVENNRAQVGDSQDGMTKTEAPKAKEEATKKNSPEIDPQKNEPPQQQTPENTTMPQEDFHDGASSYSLPSVCHHGFPSLGAFLGNLELLLGW